MRLTWPPSRWSRSKRGPLNGNAAPSPKLTRESAETSPRQLLLDRLAARDLDDSRSADLDRIDGQAREDGSWGSLPHREARDRREREYDAARARLAAMPDDAIESALATRDRPAS